MALGRRIRAHRIAAGLSLRKLSLRVAGHGPSAEPVRERQDAAAERGLGDSGGRFWYESGRAKEGAGERVAAIDSNEAPEKGEAVAEEGARVTGCDD